MPKSEMKTDEQFAVSGRAGQARENRSYEIANSKGRLQAAGDTQTDGGTETKQGTAIDPLTLKLK
jgi:type VI secretion system secreted protein VgrG